MSLKKLSQCQNLWLVFLIICLANFAKPDVVRNRKFPPGSKVVVKRYNPISNKHRENINTVTLTQKGYIQFLRYMVDVPEIKEFTFCIWLKSSNLTHLHPLLSYSEGEEKRFIRSWISPGGVAINLEILEEQVFKLPSRFKHNRWYHICNSFSTLDGAWAFYLNGKLKDNGVFPNLQGVAIPPGGDLVVGQEYTDVDKGLDDGIEGQVFGFNLVLSAATQTLAEVDHYGANYLPAAETDLRRIIAIPLESKTERNIELRLPEEEVPPLLNYFTLSPVNREPKGLYEYFFGPPQHTIRIKTAEDFDLLQVRSSSGDIISIPTHSKMPIVWNHPHPPYKHSQLNKNPYSTSNFLANKRLITTAHLEGLQRPLGLALVELGFNCALKKGAPLSEEVLVSWTKTPVRVFGGAILKNVRPFCLKNK